MGKKFVRITDTYTNEEKHLILTEDQVKLLRWLNLNEYLSEYTELKFDIEIPEITEI